jgi:site-specific DNA-methyltransferase (adenine-specific)
VTPYYSDDYVTIYHGDCREIGAWLSADVLVTDPPYGMAFIAGGGRPKRPIAGDGDTKARDSALMLWANKPALVFGRWDIPHPATARVCLTWDKGDWPGMGDLALPWGPSTEEIYVLGTGFVGKRAGTVIRCNRIAGSQVHPSEKPLELFSRLISSCPPGTIADPFMGSGTTLRAAKDLGRKAIGIELDERYCEIAAKRCAQEVLDFSEGAA